MHQALIEDFALAGRGAVVTGAASGIGRETARVLAEAGAAVMLADVDETGLAEAAAHIEAIGGRTIARRVDMADRTAVEALAEAAVTAFGRLDAWVNAAGALLNGPILEMGENQVERLIAVNQKGVYWGCAAAGRAMQPAGRGSIVNISSAGGESSPVGASVYAMTKAAVNALTRSAAREFGPFGVRVNAVAPGWIETGMVSYRFRDAAGEIDPERRAAVLKQFAGPSPLGLTGMPRDIALAVLYLASDASRFMTGQILRPNGGVAMP